MTFETSCKSVVYFCFFFSVTYFAIQVYEFIPYLLAPLRSIYQIKPPSMKSFLLKISFSFLLIFCSYSSIYAQSDIQKLDQYFEQAQKDWNIPGMAIGIVKDGKVVLAKGYGTLESGKPNQVDGNSVFAIASNTKAFIATALGILVEEGKLEWDDPVQKYLPYFQLYDDYASQQATIRDLLCHRLGLGTFSGDVIWYKSNYTAEETVKRAAEVPQAYGFRAGYGYSNLMFITAGEVIKAVSGQSWDVFIKDRIFAPLGMDRTRTSVSTLKKMENVAQPHKPSGKENNAIPYANWDNMGAAGGILSSAEDMLKWIQLQIDGGTHQGKKIFTENTQGELWKPHNNHKVSKGSKKLYPSRNFNGYGLGWGLSDYGGQMIAAHGGGYDGMYSRVTVVPGAKLGIVVLTNSMKGISTYLSYKAIDHFLEMENKDWSKIGLENQTRGEERRQRTLEERYKARLSDTQPSLALNNFTGLYSCKMYGDIEVKLEGDQLHLNFKRAPNLNAKLSHWHLNTFEIQWNEVHAWFDFGTVQFILNNNGTVQEIQFDVPNGDIFFEEIQAIKIN